MVKTAFIGAGGIAYCHANGLKKLGVEIVGAYDIVPESAKRFADTYGAKAISDIDEVLDKVDMIHLCTPPSKRVEYAKKAMEAGKHVVCEKPIAASIEDARTLIDMAKENNIKLMIAFNHRFRKGYQMLEELVKSGKLGKISNVYSYRLGLYEGANGQKSWRTDPNLICGMSVESLCHDTNMLFRLVDGVSEVKANVVGTVPGLPEFDNNASVSFRLKNGGIGTIHASWASHIKLSMRGVIGDKGSAALCGGDLWDMMELRIKTTDMAFEEVIKLNDPFKVQDCMSYYEENKHFIDCVMNGKETIVPGEQGLESLIFSRAIIESSKTGKAVKVDL